MRTLIMFILLVPFILFSNIESRVIGGTQIAKTTRPEVVIVDVDGARCSGTVVGPKVVLTAAHCGKTGQRTVVSTIVGDVRGTLYSHPSYPGKDVDSAYIILDDVLNDIKPASLGAGTVPKGADVHLLGFGCADPSGATGIGQLSIGKAQVVKYSENDFVTNGAALCFGDSGGPAYSEQFGGWVLAGTGSKGNIKDVSYFVDLGRDEVVDFISTAYTEHNARVCGLNMACEPLTPVIEQSPLHLKKGLEEISIQQNTELSQPLSNYLAFGEVTDWFLGPKAPAWVSLASPSDEKRLHVNTTGVEAGKYRFVLGVRNEFHVDATMLVINVVPIK